jgi:DNA-3-methyladenine glycosylase
MFKKQDSDFTQTLTPVSRDFYERATVQVAHDLIGHVLIHATDQLCLMGMIVETEAYCGLEDPASHAAVGKTERNKALFGPAGHAYVYLIYGLHYGFNIVAREPRAIAGGVLIRAIEPIIGFEYMQVQRKNANLRNLTSGPGKLTQAFSITRVHNHVDVTDPKSALKIVAPPVPVTAPVATTRIGITKAVDKYWRFTLPGNPWLSRP